MSREVPGQGWDSPLGSLRVFEGKSAQGEGTLETRARRQEEDCDFFSLSSPEFSELLSGGHGSLWKNKIELCPAGRESRWCLTEQTGEAQKLPC